MDEETKALLELIRRIKKARTKTSPKRKEHKLSNSYWIDDKAIGRNRPFAGLEVCDK